MNFILLEFEYQVFVSSCFQKSWLKSRRSPDGLDVTKGEDLDDDDPKDKTNFFFKSNISLSLSSFFAKLNESLMKQWKE
jgi:hypothetical protein